MNSSIYKKGHLQKFDCNCSAKQLNSDSAKIKIKSDKDEGERKKNGKKGQHVLHLGIHIIKYHLLEVD